MKPPLFATQAQKRVICRDLMSGYLRGQNLLNVKLERLIPLEMKKGHREALLNRICQEKSADAIDEMTGRLITSLTAKGLCKLEVEMKADPEAVIQLRFHHFAYVGGAVAPYGRQWSDFYEKWGDYILMGELSRLNLQRALQENLPIDVSYATYKDEMLRFSVLEPFPATQEGVKLVVNNNNNK